MYEASVALRRPAVHEIRVGSIKASIFEIDTLDGKTHDVTVTRSFRDGSAWRETVSFGREDLMLVARVLDDAHTWILRHAAKVAS